MHPRLHDKAVGDFPVHDIVDADRNVFGRFRRRNRKKQFHGHAVRYFGRKAPGNTHGKGTNVGQTSDIGYGTDNFRARIDDERYAYGNIASVRSHRTG